MQVHYMIAMATLTITFATCQNTRTIKSWFSIEATPDITYTAF